MAFQMNENQRRAIEWSEGPLLVLAGPGSGKTHVLTHRVSRLIEQNDETSALALTFTNKAATEMRERVNQLQGHFVDRVQLCTFHSFASDILRQHGSHIGLRPNFILLTQNEDRIAFLDEILVDLSKDYDSIPDDRMQLVRLIDRLFAESYDGTDSVEVLRERPEWVPELFRRYCELLLATNHADFGSLLFFANRLLRERSGVARVVRLTWTFICVDEFQDTNRAQYDMLRLIAPERRSNLFVVGDEDQIIYQWNGASPKRLEKLLRDYEIEVLQLPECYRCPSSVVKLANRLITYNRLRLSGKGHLVTSRKREPRPDVIRYKTFESPEDEAEFISQDIGTRSLVTSDCVVLGRTIKLVEQVVNTLTEFGYEAYLARRKTDFQSPKLRILFDALRLANSRHDRDVLRRLCLDWSWLTGTTLEFDTVVAAATLVGGDFLRAWIDVISHEQVHSTADVVRHIRDMLVERLEFPGVVESFLADGWGLWDERGTDDRDFIEEVEIWQELHEDVCSEVGRENLTLNTYLQRIDLSSKAPRPSSSAVRCMTVHASKGLGFRHVYLIGMAQGIFPSFHALQSTGCEQLEEERRNCFVAITRVEETLTITRSRRYYGYVKEPSQFIEEMEI